MRQLFVVALMGFGAVLAACERPCGPQSCSGCCSPVTGQCVDQPAAAACGRAGLVCVACSGAQICSTSGSCIASLAGGGSSGSVGGGAAAGGSAAGGIAAGGNAAGGNAAGGNASGGNAAGGSTAGGNAAGGNAAGGNVAGGNAAGGNVAGGNTAGGSAGGSSAIDGGYGPSGTWTRLADFPDPRYYPAATFSLDGRLFVFGGRAASAGDLDSVEVYFPPPANTWVPAPIMPMPRSGAMALTLADGGIVVMGGSNGGRMPMLFFNVFTGQWTMGAQGLNDRELAAFSMTPNGDWYVAGGGGFKLTAERYSPARGAWTPLPSLPFGLSAPGGGADLQGRLYAFGGYPNVNGATVLNFQLAPDAGAWTQVTSMPVAKGRFGNAVTDAQGRFYVVGGSAEIFAGIGAGAVESSVERYDPATDAWDTLTSMPEPRCNHAVAIDAQGRVFVIGGHTGASALSTRVDVYNP